MVEASSIDTLVSFVLDSFALLRSCDNTIEGGITSGTGVRLLNGSGLQAFQELEY